MLGLMLPTMFLSMWISNTATTAMMVPIVDAVLIELENDLNKGRDDDVSAEDEDAMVVGEDGAVVEMRTRQVQVYFPSNDEGDMYPLLHHFLGGECQIPIQSRLRKSSERR